MALEAHIVTHTHWDREWYHPLERFRQRLVGLVDELLDEPPRPGESFLLDGQTIVLDDYLAVRPERAGEVATLLRDGRLEAGPWYVLGDELIPGGEAIVRNLLAGRRALRQFAAESPPVLYCPDSFGHPAALPAIAQGFGFPIIVLWRGYGGARWPGGDTVRWRAPNGEDALVFHLPRDGYEFGSHLPPDEDGARLRWQRMRAELVPRSTAGVMLIPNGADHHARQLNLREAVAALERVGVDDGVRRSSLTGFARRLIERASLQPLPLVRGELRDSYGYTWTLQGTFGTRAHEKRLNALAERTLLRDAEPWSALAAHGGTSRRALLEQAWRTLLEAHPHDTLCGCSIDAVAEAMELRLRSAINQGAAIRDDSLAELIGYDSAAARNVKSEWQPVVVVRNPAPRRRSGVAIIDVEEFVADVPVGPGSAPHVPIHAALPKGKPNIPGLGGVQVLSRGLAYSRTESPRHYPDNDLVAVSRVAAWIADAAPYGIASHAIGRGTPRRRSLSNPVTVQQRSLSNGRVTVAVTDGGDVDFMDVESGRRIASLIGFTDEDDVGDLYTPAPRPRTTQVDFRGARRVHRGPLRGELALRYGIVALAGNDRRRNRDLTVTLTLDADASFLRIAVTGENRGKNHRLRLVIRSDIAQPDVWADAAFGAVRREPIVIAAAEAAVEVVPPTAPLHRYISLFGDAGGFSVFSDGLAEYEATAGGSVILTLVRAVGDLSRNDLPERPGHAGWPTPTPLAQCPGPFEASFAVMAHGPRTAATIDTIERTSDDVLVPLVGTTLRSALRAPPAVDGIELTGTGLAFSSFKESENGEWLVLRCVNLRDDDVAGRWRLPFELQTARVARLDETIMSEVETSGQTVGIVVPPRGISTVLVR